MPMPKILSLFLAAFAVAPAVQADAACRAVDHLGGRYIVCDYDPSDIRIFYTGRDGRPYGAFSKLQRDLRQEGQFLRFGMNGGMYEHDLSPVGLLVTDGVERHAITHASGWGNFFLKPNGVFYVSNGKAGVLETQAYAAAKLSPQFATQSGPMLVIDGRLHPAFLADSDSLKVRNGVGVSSGGRVFLAISEGPVRFHDFATLFRDGLDCPNALFLDGSISSLFSPGMKRYDNGFPLGPIIAVTGQQ